MKFNWFLKMLLPLMAFGQFSVTDGEDGGGSDGGEGGEGGDDDLDASGSKPTDGEPKKPTISDSEAKLLKEVMEKKNALKKAQEEALALKNSLKEFEGIDPAAVKALLAEKAEKETQALEAKGEWERLKAQMAQQHANEMAALQTQLNELREASGMSQKTIAELTVGTAFAQSEFIKEELALTPSKSRVVYGTHFEHVDGKVVGYDKPAGAKDRTMLVDASGEPLPFEAALRAIVDADPDRDQLLRSKTKSGADSKTQSKTKPADKQEEKLFGKDKIAVGLKSLNLSK